MKTLVTFVMLFSLSFSASAGLKNTTKIPGLGGPFLNIIDQQILIAMSLDHFEIGVGGEVKIPRTENSSLGLEPNIEGGTLLKLKIDAADIAKALKVQKGNPEVLPCGRGIPGFSTGEMKNALRFDSEKYKVSFYFNKQFFGVYYPLKINLPIAQQVAIEVKYKGNRVGIVGAIHTESDKPSGVFLFLRMDLLLKNEDLRELMERSEQDPSTLY